MYAVITNVSVAPGRFDEAVGEANSMVIPLLTSQAGYLVSYFQTKPIALRGSRSPSSSQRTKRKRPPPLPRRPSLR